VAKSLGPLVAWQALHAVAGTMELQQINRKLEVAVKGIHDLRQRELARDLGEMRSAFAVLGDLLAEEQTTGSVSSAMLSRLAGVELLVGAQIYRILELVEAVKREVEGLKAQQGPRATKSVAEFLREKGPSIQRDIEALLTLVASDLKIEELLLRRSLEYSPEDADRRLKRIQEKVSSYQSTFQGLPSLEALLEQAEAGLEELGWWHRNILSRDIAKNVDRLKELHLSDMAAEKPLLLGESPMKIVLWEDEVGRRHARAFPIESGEEAALQEPEPQTD